MKTPPEADMLAEADRLLDEHIAPASVVRALGRDTCPYCRAYPTLPCAHHRGRE